jgi:hypothetical protein
MSNPLAGRLPVRVSVVGIYMFLVLHHLPSAESVPASNQTPYEWSRRWSEESQHEVNAFSLQFVMNISTKLQRNLHDNNSKVTWHWPCNHDHMRIAHSQTITFIMNSSFKLPFLHRIYMLKTSSFRGLLILEFATTYVRNWIELLQTNLPATDTRKVHSSH